jgi:hypothetical protein
VFSQARKYFGISTSEPGRVGASTRLPVSGGNQAGAELFDFSIRNLVREKRKLAIRRPGRRDPIWGEYFHLSVGSIRVLGARHSVAPFLSVLDVPRDHRTEPSQKYMGPFHRRLCRWFVELREYFCNNVLPQWPARTFQMGSDRTSGAARPTYCGACMVFKSVCCHWMSLGVLQTSHKISPRCRQIRHYIRPHDRILRPGYGSVSASVSRPFSSNAASTSALIGLTRFFPANLPSAYQYFRLSPVRPRAARGALQAPSAYAYFSLCPWLQPQPSPAPAHTSAQSGHPNKFYSPST